MMAHVCRNRSKLDHDTFAPLAVSRSDRMCVNSVGFTRPCVSGAPYIRFQKISHAKPAAPAMTNAAFQPQVAAMNGTVAGANIAPTLAPELNRLVANARSLRGNHSATDLIAAGKFPASLTPRKMRADMNPLMLPTSEWTIAATLQNAIETP